MESELVSDFMTEHATIILVFFFLTKYASIVLICILISILFLGEYVLSSFFSLFYLLLAIVKLFDLYITFLLSILDVLELIFEYTYSYINTSTCIMIFVFIWARASFPRIRFDQLMSFCWTILLPLVISFIIVISCALHSFDTIPSNVFLL